jgi:hypothetical protein
MRRHLLQSPGTLPLDYLCLYFDLWDGGYMDVKTTFLNEIIE